MQLGASGETEPGPTRFALGRMLELLGGRFVCRAWLGLSLAADGWRPGLLPFGSDFPYCHLVKTFHWETFLELPNSLLNLLYPFF